MPERGLEPLRPDSCRGHVTFNKVWLIKTTVHPLRTFILREFGKTLPRNSPITSYLTLFSRPGVLFVLRKPLLKEIIQTSDTSTRVFGLKGTWILKVGVALFCGLMILSTGDVRAQDVEDWKTIAVFEGNGQKNTGSFTVEADMWRIQCYSETTPSSLELNLRWRFT